MFIKKAAVILTALTCSVSLLSAQDITMSGGRMSLRKAFELIETQSGKSVAYNEGVINIGTIIEADQGTFPLEKVLETICAQSRLDFSITDKLIVITKGKDILNGYSGRVLDDEGKALPAAMVIDENTGEYTTTLSDGSFRLEKASKGDMIRVSFLGYRDRVYTLGADKTVDIRLESDSEILENAVVIGYGSVKRKDLTTAVSVVSTEDIETRPIVSAGSVLQGKAAGVQVIQPSGMPGSGISIRVRGATSVQASNEPLYVVDGVPTDDISNVSPGDISSLQVLKDASSSAIYGARAANGVVLITTKRGDAGKTSVKFNFLVGFSRLGNKIDALNTEQYKELMSELAANTVTVPTIPESENRYTDWSDVLFSTGVNQNYQLSVSSGTDKLRYYVSAGHTDDKGIVNKAYFRRTHFRANVDSDLYDWLSASVNVGYSYNRGRSVYESRSSMRAGSILSAVNTPPFMQIWNPENPTIYDEDAYGSRILNPMAANAADMTYQSNRLLGSASLGIKPFKGFVYKISYSLDINDSRDDYYLDPLSTSDGRSTKGYVSESVSNNREWMLDNIITYDFDIADRHRFGLMGGVSLKSGVERQFTCRI